MRMELSEISDILSKHSELCVKSVFSLSYGPNVKIHRGGGGDGREARWSRMPRCNGRISRLEVHNGQQDEREHFP